MNTQATPESQPSSKRWKAIGLLVLVFVLGIVMGVGGSAMVVRRTLQQKIASGTVGDNLVDHLEKELARRLKLTPAEQAAVAPEFEITRQQIQAHRKEMLKSMRDTSEDTLARVKSKLPPEKQILLEDAVRKQLAPWGLLKKQ
jgi:hypothetical protein